MNTGCKRKVLMNSGAFYVPYNPFMHMGYQDYLRRLTQKFNSWVSGTFVKDKVQGLEEATEMMQQRYPGNYTLIEKYNSTRSAFELEVKFDNLKEEMLWKMKWA